MEQFIAIIQGLKSFPKLFKKIYEIGTVLLIISGIKNEKNEQKKIRTRNMFSHNIIRYSNSKNQQYHCNHKTYFHFFRPPTVEC